MDLKILSIVLLIVLVVIIVAFVFVAPEMGWTDTFTTTAETVDIGGIFGESGDVSPPGIPTS